MSTTIDYLMAGIIGVLSSIGLLGFVIKGQNEKIKDQQAQNEKTRCLIESCVSNEHCILKRENVTLEIKAHISTELEKLKDDIMPLLRQSRRSDKKDENV